MLWNILKNPIVTSAIGFIIGIFIEKEFNIMLFNRPRLIIRNIQLKHENGGSEQLARFIVADLFNEGRGTIKNYYCYINDKRVFDSLQFQNEALIEPYHGPMHWEGFGFPCKKEEFTEIEKRSKIIVLYVDFNGIWFYSDGSYEKGIFKQGKQARLVKLFINRKLGKYVKLIKGLQPFRGQ